MRNYIFYFLMPIITCSLYSQTSKTIVEKTLYIQYDTSNKTLPISITLPDNDFFGRVLYRNFYKNTTKVQSEYIKLRSDTLLYVEYDSLVHQKITKKGYVYLSNNCPREDTIALIDPLTYDVIMKVRLGCTAIRNGFWIENINGFECTGNYKNGKKQGDWHIIKPYPEGDDYFTYNNDTLINIRHANLLKTNSLDTIKATINGKYIKSKYNFRRFFQGESRNLDELSYMFESDGTGIGEQVLEFQGEKTIIKSKFKWVVTPQYLTLTFENSKVEKYKLAIINTRVIIFENE